MKAYSIGRDESCDIVIDDNESLVSRKHALLKVFLTGKMELVDMSSNGTFVNGHAIARNKPYPVTRKDVITFARVKQLDWKLVPDYRKRIILCAAALLLAIVVILAVTLWTGSKPNARENTTIGSPMPSVPEKTGSRDSTTKKQKDAEEQEEMSMKEIQEMLRKTSSKSKKSKTNKDRKEDTTDNEDSKNEKTDAGAKQNQDKSSSTDKKNESEEVHDAIEL